MRIKNVRINTDVTYFEQLNTDDGEHELEQEGDQHDVVDGFHGDDDALDDVLSTRRDSSTGKLFRYAVDKASSFGNRSNSVRCPKDRDGKCQSNLQAFGAIDGSQRSQDTEHSKNFYDIDGAITENRKTDISGFKLENSISSNKSTEKPWTEHVVTVFIHVYRL